ILRRPTPRPTPCPYTTLFRSGVQSRHDLSTKVSASPDGKQRGRDMAPDDAIVGGRACYWRGDQHCRRTPEPFDSDRYGLQRELRSEEHTSELQSRENLVCRLL